MRAASLSCPNMNHRRSDAPVAFCPTCGVPVNRLRATSGCTEARHAAARRQQTVFCVDCGTKLIHVH